MRFKIFIISCLVGLSQFAFGQALVSPTSNERALSGANPPGYVDPTLWGSTCFDYMGAIDFSSSYRFITSYYNASAPTGWTGGLLNPSNNRLAGFSIPLVGDLDGDGYPEIIGIGQTDAGYSLYGAYEYVYIYNGQTGKQIAKLPFTGTDGTTAIGLNTSGGYHQAPSIAALVNSDGHAGDKTIEIIVAFPRSVHKGGSAGTPFASAVASYNIKKKTDGSGGYTLENRWVSSAKYNTPASDEYQRTSPQIVDLDGDGTPEVLVYNKIYNARTGALLLTLETLGTTAFVGTDMTTFGGEYNRDRYQGFNYVYDMDGDGIYDVVAGGKVYKITKENGTFKYEIIKLPNPVDGRTSVADINGDGIADVITTVRTGALRASPLKITVWNPGFRYIDTNGQVVNHVVPVPYIITETTVQFDDTSDDTGSYSYVYIGDIDGREQIVGDKVYRLPEIAILSRGPNISNFPRHPNINGITEANGGIPASYTYPYATRGTIFAYTYDVVGKDLKGSFIMEHEDRSIDTGFTMFDFDNDGVQEICYRDEQTLRIIKPTIPFVKRDNADSKVILFKQNVKSFTGFEYPVIADVDNDASAEMIVIGHDVVGDYAMGYVYAVGTNKDKFAPALPVWNQFMYDPFKINEDLTTPLGKAVDRLQFQYRFTQVIRDDNGTKTKVIENYNPYNCTLGQLPRFMLNEGEHDSQAYNNMFEPIIFLTEAYLVDEKSTDIAKRPKIVTIDNNHYIQVYVGNKSSAKTDIAGNTPITIYNDKIGGGTYIKKVTLKNCGLLASAIKAGELVKLNIPIENQFGSYIFRLGDDSNFANTANVLWHFGTNTALTNDQVAFKGTSTRAYRDCSWADQTARASKFLLVDDPLTLQEYGTITTNILSNDILPDDFAGTFNSAIITQLPTAGTLAFSGTNLTGNIVYTHTGGNELADGIDKFTYQLSYRASDGSTITQTATVYIFILQSDIGGFAACYNESFTAKLKNTPIATLYDWYKVDGITPEGINPQQSITIPNITTTMTYKVKPVVDPVNVLYGAIDFPLGDLKISTATNSAGEIKHLTWTGLISSDWYNPGNWQDGAGLPVSFAPTICIDVTIPKVITNYPSLGKAGKANKLNLNDRAMIANTHKLSYNALSVKLTVKDAEQNKWMLLSAPLRKIYSGDYLPKDIGNSQIKKGMYMSYYEKKNPDNTASQAEASTFTRPFGRIESELVLGQGFMLYADKNYVTNPTLIFPSGTQVHTYNMHHVQGMSERTYLSETLSSVDDGVDVSNGQFLFEAATDLNTADGSFTIPYSGTYILIVNPFPAYLSLNKLLEVNSSILAQQYKIWSGTSDNFIELVNGTDGAHWKIKNGATLNTVVSGTEILIAPFQSFFVKSISGGAINIKYQPETMTKVIATDFSY